MKNYTGNEFNSHTNFRNTLTAQYVLYLVVTFCSFAQETKRLPLRSGVVLINSLSFPGPVMWFKYYTEAKEWSPMDGDNSIHFFYSICINLQVLMA